MPHDQFKLRQSDRVFFAAIRVYVCLRYLNVCLWQLSKCLKVGQFPNPALPKTANDKYFWRKAFDHDPRFTLISDKLACKDWIKEKGLGLKVAPVRWQGVRAEDLPQEFVTSDAVIKTNHSSRTNIILAEEPLSYAMVVKRARKFLRSRKPWRLSQWGYYDIPKKLFVEDRIDGSNCEMHEVKVYTYGGQIIRVVRYCEAFGLITADRWFAGPDGLLAKDSSPPAVARRLTKGTLFDRPLPESWDRALAVACEIGKEFDHLRVDLICVGEDIWWGEATVYNSAGQLAGEGNDPDGMANMAWDLRNSDFLRNPPKRGWRSIYARRLKAII